MPAMAYLLFVVFIAALLSRLFDPGSNKIRRGTLCFRLFRLRKNGAILLIGVYQNMFAKSRYRKDYDEKLILFLVFCEGLPIEC